VRWTEAELRGWSRPESVLLPDEARRVGEWLSLFGMELERRVSSAEPTVVEIFAARRFAEIVWEWDRATSSREVVVGRKKRPSRLLERCDIFEESEIRSRLNAATLEEIDATRRFADIAGGAVELNVVPFRKQA
jgi:hypothetical protein